MLRLERSSVPLAPGRYFESDFRPTVTFEITTAGLWVARQAVPGFFDIQQDPDTLDVIALQFCRPTTVYRSTNDAVPARDAAGAVAAVRSNPDLKVSDPTSGSIAGRPALLFDIETTTPRESDPPIFSPVIGVSAGPISLASARRLRIGWLNLEDGPLAVLVGGSIDAWASTLAATEPVMATVRLGDPVVRLRAVEPDDLDVLFEQQTDSEANRMAAFGANDPADRGAFDAHWNRIQGDESVVIRVIEADGEVAGSILRWRDPSLDGPELSYWLGRDYWGRGLGTEAVRLFLLELTDRTLFGRAAATNPASIRVLEKSGFGRFRIDRDVSSTSGARVDEVILRLAR